MSTIIKPDSLAKEIQKALEDYRDTTDEACAAGIIQTAEKCVSELQNAAPAGSGKYGSWSDYNRGWTRTKLKANKKGGYSEAVHNAKHYQLAHLLENGHALRGGGRTRAFPHIAPVAEKAEQTLLENIKNMIQRN